MYLHTEDPQILVATLMYLVARATWHSGFVQLCLNCFLWPSVYLSHVFPSWFFRALHCDTVSCCTRLIPQGKGYLTSPLFQGIIRVPKSLMFDVSGEHDGIRTLNLGPARRQEASRTNQPVTLSSMTPERRAHLNRSDSLTFAREYFLYSRFAMQQIVQCTHLQAQILWTVGEGSTVVRQAVRLK